MKEKFLKIAITPERIRQDEAERITSLLTSDEVNLVHLRHPLHAASKEEVRNLLLSIPAVLHPALTLHDHFTLAEEFAIGGLHLNSRNPAVPEGLHPKVGKLRFSKSMHSLQEMEEIWSSGAISFDYVTLSPIFDSISKEGYRSHFDLSQVRDFLDGKGYRVVALGGVTPNKIPLLKDNLFKGAAMLGHFFPPEDKKMLSGES